MKEIAAACAAYFQEHPAYHRILVLLFQKVKSFGGPAGTVRLDDATPEECDAARALFGRSFSAPLRIKTADFEAALQNTPYHGVTLKEVLECYFHTAIQTKREIRSQEDARILRITRGRPPLWRARCAFGGWRSFPPTGGRAGSSSKSRWPKGKKRWGRPFCRRAKAWLGWKAIPAGGFAWCIGVRLEDAPDLFVRILLCSSKCRCDFLRMMCVIVNNSNSIYDTLLFKASLCAMEIQKTSSNGIH